MDMMGFPWDMGPGQDMGPQGNQESRRGWDSTRDTASRPDSGSTRNTGPRQNTRQMQDMRQGPQMGPGGSGRPGGGGGGPGMPGGMDNMLSRAGADEFFDAVKKNVLLGDVIYIDDPMSGSLIVGVTGKWISNGILREVRSENGRANASQCDFSVTFSGGMGMGGGGMGPGGGGPGQTASEGKSSKFVKVFSNEYGSLYRNTAKVQHNRQPLKPDVSLLLLAVIALVGFVLVLMDYLPVPNKYARPAAAAIGTIIVALCFLPLTSTAIGELRNPVSVSQARWDAGPGFGGPGLGPP